MTLRSRLSAALASSALVALASATTPVLAQEQAVDLIPRNVLFGNPDRAAVRVSPDGRHMSFLAPVEGVLNVWVAPIGDLSAAQPITRDTGRGITQYFWAYTGEHVVYLQDEGGNENDNLFVVDLDSGETRPLVRNPAVKVSVSGVSDKRPGEILVGLNDRNPMFHDLYKVDLASGEKTQVLEHPGMINNQIVAGLTADDDFNVRFASAFRADGGIEIFERQGEGEDEGGWSSWRTVHFEDTMTTGMAGFGRDPQIAYLISSEGRDTAAFYLLNLDTGEQTLLAADERADIGGAMIHPTEKTVQAVSFNFKQQEWKILDDAIAADAEYLSRLAGDAEWSVTSRTQDDATWVVAISGSDRPVQYYLYRRTPGSGAAGTSEYLFSNNTRLEGLALQKMHPVVIPASDGKVEMVSYVTLPPSAETRRVDGLDVPVPEAPLPTVLVVHGGPWARDSYGYDPMHQWLANRGYAVISPNFRGSTGFGKNHINAGNREWGRAMQQDLTDVVAWAVEHGIADADRVAIMGGSYGGYAALAGLTLTPDVYAAGVSIVGPSSIETLLKTVPPYWAPAMVMFKTRVGDHTTAEGRQALAEVSPLTHVDRIVAPLLIGQGANDPRVRQSESDQIVSAMKERQIPVTYVLYPDEGHGFARPENRLSFFGITEAFLAEHLGGRYQPLGPDDLENSSLKVPAGADGVPGLKPLLSE